MLWESECASRSMPRQARLPEGGRDGHLPPRFDPIRFDFPAARPETDTASSIRMQHVTKPDRAQSAQSRLADFRGAAAPVKMQCGGLRPRRDDAEIRCAMRAEPAAERAEEANPHARSEIARIDRDTEQLALVHIGFPA